MNGRDDGVEVEQLVSLPIHAKFPFFLLKPLKRPHVDLYHISMHACFQHLAVFLSSSSSLSCLSLEAGRTDVPVLLGVVQYHSQSSLTSFSEGSVCTDHPGHHSRGHV